MSEDRLFPPEPDRGPASPETWAAADDRRQAARAAAAMTDLFLDPRDRLHEQTRVAALAVIEAAVARLERDLRHLLGEAAGAASNLSVAERLTASGLLRDPPLIEEAVAQARLAAIDAALVAQRAPGTSVDLIQRLSRSDDRKVRAATLAWLIAENARAQGDGDLPPALHRRTIWWVAAALRERLPADAATDRALAEAAERSIAAREETPDVVEAAAALAAAIDAAPADLPHLLPDVLAEGRTHLFVALLAHGLSLDAGEARALVLDAEGDRLCFALRALGFTRPTIARVGWMLGEADMARDVERLPGALDRCEAMTAQAARRALATMALPAPFRAAVRALGRAA